MNHLAVGTGKWTEARSMHRTERGFGDRMAMWSVREERKMKRALAHRESNEVQQMVLNANGTLNLLGHSNALRFRMDVDSPSILLLAVAMG